MNPGTAKTPGEHLRITGVLSNQLTALSQALNKLGIETETKYKPPNLMIVIIRSPKPEISFSVGFLRQLPKEYSLGLGQVKESTSANKFHSVGFYKPNLASEHPKDETIVPLNQSSK